MEIKMEREGCESRITLPVRPLTETVGSLKPEYRDSLDGVFLRDIRKNVIHSSEGYYEVIGTIEDYLSGRIDRLPDSIMGRAYRASYLSEEETSRVEIRLFRASYRKGSVLQIKGNGTSLALPMFVVSSMFGLAREELKEYFREPDKALGFLLKGFEVINVCAEDTSIVVVR